MQEGDAREQGKIIRPYFLLLKTNAKLYGNQKKGMSDYEEKKVKPKK